MKRNSGLEVTVNLSGYVCLSFQNGVFLLRGSSLEKRNHMAVCSDLCLCWTFPAENSVNIIKEQEGTFIRWLLFLFSPPKFPTNIWSWFLWDKVAIYCTKSSAAKQHFSHFLGCKLEETGLWYLSCFQHRPGSEERAAEAPCAECS